MTEIKAHTKFGFCRGCKKWVPRDDMLSVNVSVYDKINDETRHRIRLCEACCDQHVDFLEGLGWDGVLKTAEELGIIQRPVEDDSEAALRRQGVEVDI